MANFRLWGPHISETYERIFAVQSFKELLKPAVVQRHVHFPIYPYGIANRTKLVKLGTFWAQARGNAYLLDHVLEWFTPFVILWIFLDLQLCIVMVISPFDPWHIWVKWRIFSFQSSMELSQIVVVHHHCHLSNWAERGMGLFIDSNTYVCNCWLDFLHLELRVIFYTCSSATWWEFAHLTWLAHRPDSISLKPFDAFTLFNEHGSMGFSRPVVVQRHGGLHICPIRACPWTKNVMSLESRLCAAYIPEFTQFEFLCNCLDPLLSIFPNGPYFSFRCCVECLDLKL